MNFSFCQSRNSFKGIIVPTNIMITDFSFGKIVVGGVSFTNDIKILQGKVIPDWWRKSGHVVDVGDVADMLDSQPDILLLGKGQPGLMKSTRSLQQLLESKGIELIEEKTTSAIKTFNRLTKEGKNVCAGFHVSC